MNKKQFAAYAAEMDEKFHVVQTKNEVIETRDDLIDTSNTKLFKLVDALKDDVDMRIFRCYSKRFYMYDFNWFDIYIPKYKLGIKLCRTKQEKDIAFQLYRNRPIVLFDISQDITLDDMLVEIIQKIAKIGEMEENKK